MAEVGQLLRHTQEPTTATYALADRACLARPCPERRVIA
jgi:hypothetical protein